MLQVLLSTHNVKADSSDTLKSVDSSSDIKELRTVRVGYYEKPGILEGASIGAKKDGYSFELLRNIADFAGWDIEYVYGEKEHLIDELKDGRIDLIPGVIKNDEYSNYFDYSLYSLFSEDYVLFLRNSDSAINGDFSLLDGATLGLSAEFKDLADLWIEKTGYHPQVKFYDSNQKVYQGFLNNETDAFIAPADYFADHIIYAMNVDTISSYFVTSKKAEGLCNEMNSAIMALFAAKSGVMDELKYKYLQTNLKVRKVSAVEQSWLDDHKTLRMGVLYDNMPYSFFDSNTGSAQGLISIFMENMCDTLSLDDLSIEYIFYNTYDQMTDDLGNGIIDAAFPVVSYYDVALERDYMYTEPVASSHISLIYRDSIDLENLSSVAYDKNLLASFYVDEVFPKIGSVLCDSRVGALHAVTLGTAECALLNEFSSESLLLTDTSFMSLKSITLPSVLDLSLGVKRGNTALFSLLNRGVSNVSDSYIADTLALLLGKQSAVPYEQLYLITHKNIIVAIIISLLIFCIIAICFASIGIKNRRYSAKLKITSEELIKEAAGSANRETIISTLADKYELVIYYDSLRDEARILRCKGIFAKYIDSLTSQDRKGDESNVFCDSSKLSYDDVDKFLKKYVMSDDYNIIRETIKKENLIQLLRKKDNYYITFRILVNGEAKYYRIYFAADRINPESIVIGFSDVDAEVRLEEELADEEHRRGNFLKDCLQCTLVKNSSEDSIMQMLELVTGFFNADRAYVFETNRDKTFISNTYEWCRDGVGHEKNNLQQIEISRFNDWIEVFREQGSVYISSLEEDLSTSSYSYELLKQKGVKKLLISPLFIGDSFEGFVSIDNQRKFEADTRTLSSLASILLSQILRVRQAGEDRQIIDRLTDTYLAVFYANLETGYLRNYTIVEEYSSVYGIANDYNTALNLFVENEVAKRFKAEVLELLSPQNIIKKFETGNELVYSYMGRLKGQLCNIELKVLKADEGGKCAVISFLDRTAQVKKELEYQETLVNAKNLAEAANLAKSKFLSKMSHDIRTPMNGVIGMTAIAEKYIDDKERVADCLHKIDSASKHLLALINDVLDMSQIESGKVVLNLKPVNLENFFASCFAIVEWQLKDKCIELITVNEPFRHNTVYADELRLRQVVINILGNAIKFTPPNGTIYFRSSEEVLEDGRVHYHGEIEDTGIGMKPEFVSKIFDEFTQEDEGNTTHYKGTGLGMPIAKQLVEMMGGTIDVKSELNKGTTVTVDLVLTDCDSVNESMNEDRMADFTGKKILVAEDNEINLEITNEILHSQGMVVSSATDGRKALEKFIESEPFSYDAILMDIMMPEMDGYEAARSIRALDRPDAKSVPIIAMTANAFAEDVDKALEAGMNDHLSKPVVVEALLKTLSGNMKKTALKQPAFNEQ